MSEIAIERRGPVTLLTLNRPQKKNALTLAMYEALGAAFLEAQDDPAVRCLILYGGAEAFTAGNDLKDFMQAPPANDDAPVFRFMRTAIAFPKPLIAAVAGVAVGIGVTLLPYCDLVYAADTASFQMPFVNLGLPPELGATFTLPWMLGPLKASEHLLLGSPFGADEAQRLGLVNAVVSKGELLPQALAAAEQIAAKPPAAVRLTKQLLRQSWVESALAALQREGPRFVAALSAPECQEALAAFVEKRKPDFSRFS